MNKLYNVLISGLVFFGAIQANAQQEPNPSFSPEEIQRFEVLSSLYEKGIIESIKYDFNGDASSLNNDIALVEKHAAMMFSDKSNAEQVIYAKVIPIACKAISAASGILSIGLGCLFVAVNKAIYTISCDPNLTLENRYGSLRIVGKVPHNLEMSAGLADGADPEALFEIAGVVIVLGIAAKGLWTLSNRNQLFIEKTQKAYDQDQEIIVALKKIRYELANS